MPDSQPTPNSVSPFIYPTLYDKPLSVRKANTACKELKKLGYGGLTRKIVQGKTIAALALYLEPSDEPAALALMDTIAQFIGVKPQQKHG